MHRNRKKQSPPRGSRARTSSAANPPSQALTPSAPTSWDPVANWYKHWMGRDGSEYHRKLAIPTVLDLLSLQPRETVLDVGCGTGTLAKYLTQATPGIRYVGVDASPRLLAVARRKHGEAGTFFQGDARRLREVEGVSRGMTDAAVFLLSIQDMDPLSEVIASVAWAVNETGRIVILMMHPCFRIPRQSGWGWDSGRKLQYRRVDSYLTPMSVPVRPIVKGGTGSIKSFHAPLHTYMNELVDRGFLIDRLVELPAYPGIVRRGSNARAENRANREIPVFLGLRAVRVSALHAT